MTHYFGRLFDDLTHAVANFADASSQALEEAYDVSRWDPSSIQELSSAATLAQVDLLMLDWADSDNAVIPAEARPSANESVERIKQGLHEVQAGYLAGTERTEDQKPSVLARQHTIPMQSAAAEIEELVNNIKPKEAPITVEDNSESRLDARQMLDPRIAEWLNVLRAALVQQLSSCDHRHVVRLKLTGFSGEFDFDSQKRLLLDVFLSSRFDWKPCRWLQGRCTIVRSLQNSETKGCQFIKDTEKEKYSLALRISEQPLGNMIRDPNTSFADSNFPTVSLGSLIDDRYFNTMWGEQDKKNRTFLAQDRATLCYILAKSVSHLSGDAWNHIRWNVDGIYFLEDPNTQMLLDKHKPYLSWKLEQPTSDAQGEENRGDDPYLQLVDFARLLMEVHAGERIKFLGPAESLHPYLYTLIHDRQRFMSPEKENFRLAVEACLGPAGKEAAQDRSDPERIKIFIFQHVLPNFEMCSAVYTEPRLEGNQILGGARLLNGNGVVQGKRRSPYDGKKYDTPQNESAAKDAEEFVNRMESFTNKHILPLAKCCMKLPKHLEPRIKIAIIDSGINCKDTRIIALSRGGRIKEKRNFLPGPPDAWEDDFGHGTHVAWLVLKMAPRADIYVAKVSDGWSVDASKVNCIAQAVNWAVQEWQVDIITMSLVLHGTNDAIQAQLKQAVDPDCEGLHRRIVFAAAGNNGGNDPMPWPASLQVSCRGIIPIHATDGMGTAMNINPTVAENVIAGDELKSFATLGRDIKSLHKPPSCPAKPVYISGTSFATPIAAAIAANVLEYARHKLPLTKEQKNILYSGVCMRKMFAKMGQNRGDYYYVQPWTLWDRGWDTGFGSCRKILEVLQDVIGS